jgi:L-cysteine/cystine lyase
MDLVAVRRGLPVLERYAYLNAGTFGPLPRATAEAMQALERRELEEGRSSRAYFEQALADRELLRGEHASLVRAQPERIALTTSTTEGCNIVLSGLGLRPEDEVVTTDSEHPGLMGGLVASGVRLRIAAIKDLPAADVLEAIRDEVTPRTRLIALSHVSWITGVALPVGALAGHGVPVLVDGAQAAGTIPVDVGALGVDFYTVSAQKWLLGPAATGALYVGEEWLERCRVASPSYFSWKLPEYELKDTAARFEGSWTPPPAVAGLLASFAFAAEAGGERFARARAMTERCRALLAEHGADVVTEPDQGTLVSWRSDEPEAVVARLADQGVVVRDLPGTGLVRASCGFWTSEDDLERLVRGIQPGR